MTSENREGDPEGIERRRHPRHPIKLRILFQRDGLTHFLEAEAENVSEGGVYIETNRRPPEPGTELSLILPLPDGELMVSGKVRWVVHQGMGIEFVGLDDSTRDRLQSFIAGIES